MTVKKKFPPAITPLATEAAVATKDKVMDTPVADLDVGSAQPAPTEVPQLSGPSAQDFRGWVNTLHHHGFLSDGDARALKDKIDAWQARP